MKLVRNDFNAWHFIQGDAAIPIDGKNVFSSRTEAVTAARRVGLRVAGDGLVLIARCRQNMNDDAAEIKLLREIAAAAVEWQHSLGKFEHIEEGTPKGRLWSAAVAWQRYQRMRR